MPSKKQSGTFAVIYELRNASQSDLLLAPMTRRFREASGLRFNHDIRPTDNQMRAFQHQFKITLIKVLSLYIPTFGACTSHSSLQFLLRRPIPDGYKTKFYPLRATTIDKATTTGNIHVHEDAYITQLKQSSDSLGIYAIPSINDQMTNSRIRSAKLLRVKDVNPWTRREVFQLGFGLFHACLNLVWALLHVHRGTLGQAGSLTFFFSIMGKTRLGCEHPDYHSLLMALRQILHGLTLSAWKIECGYSSLEAFAASEPSPETLLRIAGKILLNHASPMDETVSDPAAQNPNNDCIRRNVRLLMRDLLYIEELVCAISDGDWGRVEDILPSLAMMFRGAGSNKYCVEILHFIFNLKKVWTAEFAYVYF